MSEISISELDDKEGKIYALGLGDVADSVREWMLSENFRYQWEERFDHSDFIILPVASDIHEVDTLDVDKLMEELEDE